jgi:heme oxygenase
MPPSPLQEAPAFSTVLRRTTTPDHGAAEGAGFMTALMAGALDRDAVGTLAVQLLTVYRALEAAVAPYVNDAVLGPVLDPALARTAALEADVAALACGLRPSPAAQAYAARINAVADRNDLLLAHHYTRYLGDLSGGQAIGTLVRRHYGLVDAGTAFYTFDGIADPMAFKRGYREHLDRLPDLGVDLDAFIHEVRLAYTHNRAVIDELDALRAQAH